MRTRYIFRYSSLPHGVVKINTKISTGTGLRRVSSTDLRDLSNVNTKVPKFHRDNYFHEIAILPAQSSIMCADSFFDWSKERRSESERTCESRPLTSSDCSRQIMPRLKKTNAFKDLIELGSSAIGLPSDPPSVLPCLLDQTGQSTLLRDHEEGQLIQ